MAQNSDNIAIVRPVVNGAAWVGGEDATVPTSASEQLQGMSSLGWLDENGISMSVNRETTDLVGFGGDTALTLTTSHDVEFTFKPMEWNEVVAKEMFGADNVTEGAASVKINSDELPIRKYVFDMRGRGNTLIRVVVPNCQLTSFGEFPFKHNEPMAAEFTLKALPDADGNKVYIYKAEQA